MTSALWAPSKEQINAANLTRFGQVLSDKMGRSFESYEELHDWSVAHKEDFWGSLWDYCDVIGSKGPKPFLDNEEDFIQSRFFPNGTLNYAENMLKGLEGYKEEEEIIVFWSEKGFKTRITKADFLADVKKFRAWFEKKGLRAGDRVCALLPNTPKTIAALLAASSMGLVWGSCSPDFGVDGILDRFQQIHPKAFLSCDGYYYKGRFFELEEKVTEIADALGVQDATLIFSYPGGDSVNLQSSFLEKFEDLEASEAPLTFAPLSFNHPLFIMFSSGTTGRPKCIIHGAGGTLLQHLKEHQLHCDIKPRDRVFYFSTCSWMMWNWHVSAMASGAVLLLFDGFPFLPTATVLFDFAEEEKMTLFGTASKYIDALRKREFKLKDTHDLTHLRMITSTGGPLVHESFEYINQDIKQDLCVASISGGTDIISCFVLGCPILPVYPGQIQCKGLGMDVDVFNAEGKPVTQEKGELVCKTPFPSKPLGFMNDPEDAKFKASYFEEFDNIWCHGDYAEITPEGGIVIYGRSDTVLNPGGVRIGTAEIYRQVEKIEDVTESLAVGQEWDDDMRVILFVTLKEGVTLDDSLKKGIRTIIKENASPRHVPSKIVHVPDLPKTKNGKLMEGVVRHVIHDRPVVNKSTLANPECLKYFKDVPDLKMV